MNIRQKILIGATLLTLVPVLLTAGFLWQGASSLSATTVKSLNQAQLVALRESKKQDLLDEFNTRVRSLQALGAQRSTVDAMKAFKAGFGVAAKETSRFDPISTRARLVEFLQADFLKNYVKRNAKPHTEQALNPVIGLADPNALALQSEFIFNNPNPTGEKEKLITPVADTSYARAHSAFHPGLERAQKTLEFYDLFLIDTDTSSVVYTVFKELDFASSLIDGVAAKTKLSEAFSKVKNAANRDVVYLSDFEPYLPSYNDQAAFLAVPLFDGDRQVGVLAAQYPIDKISESMSAHKAWSKFGLGESGDVFVVGPDLKMRSNARYIYGDRDRFLQQIAESTSETERGDILKRESTIGLVKIDSGATRAAIQGTEGFTTFKDYRGVDVYGAYTPLKILGLNWGLVTKIDVSEADTPTRELNRSSLLRSVLTGLAVLIGSLILITPFLRRFLKPIETLSTTVSEVQAGNIDARSNLAENDEIGDLGRSFDKLLDERNAQYRAVEKENETLNNSVIALLQSVFQLSNRDLTVRAPVTEDVVGTVSSSINQFADETGQTLKELRGISTNVASLSSTVQANAKLVEESAQSDQRALSTMAEDLTKVSSQLTQVASLSTESNDAATRVSASTDAALVAVQGSVRGMYSLRQTISEMEKRFKRLGERSQEISSVITLINTISERTHVLAVNASMQAATAGEAGRGFAVVASEVQRLSDNSRQATAQISQLVSNIQSDTNATLVSVNRLIGEVVAQTDLGRQAGAQMAETRATTERLVALVKDIAAFSQQQTQLASALRNSVQSLSEGAAKTTRAISDQTASTDALATNAQRMLSSVGQFKLDDLAQG